jgi:hypothetical protein
MWRGEKNFIKTCFLGAIRSVVFPPLTFRGFLREQGGDPMSVALIFPFVRPVCIHCDISIDFKADAGVACLTVSFRVEVSSHL